MVSESPQPFSRDTIHSPRLGPEHGHLEYVDSEHDDSEHDDLEHDDLEYGNSECAHSAHGHSRQTPSQDWISDRYEIQHPLPLQPNPRPSNTFLAWDHQTQIPVVLKTLPIAELQHWKSLDLFEREARALSQLNHPAIPRYLDYIEERIPDDSAPTAFYLVQAYIEGPSLAECVLRGDRFSEASVKAIARQGLELLSYLHQLNPPLIHRDIKPDNIICSPYSTVTDELRIHLVDFGAAQAITSSGSTIIGTYGYMAPEQFLGQASTASDLYSLGATLIHLLTHQNPGTLPSHRLRIDFRSVVNLNEDFAQWLDRLMAPMAADRFHSATQALAALDDPALLKPALENPDLENSSLENSILGDPPLSAEPLVPVPSHSAIRLHRHSGKYPLGQPSLTLEIPPMGLQRELWALGGFALLWNGGLLYWLIMAWTMDAPWFYPLASTPLWGLGLWLIAHLGESLFGQVRFMVNNDQYCLEKQFGPFRQSRRGPISDWQSIGLRVQYHQNSRQSSSQDSGQDIIQTINQAIAQPSSEPSNPKICQTSEAGATIAMVLGLETVEFGSLLSAEEKTWLVRELQDFLTHECRHISGRAEISSRSNRP